MLLATLAWLLPGTVYAQRPKNEQDALAKYGKAADNAEEARRRAVGDLGPYAGEAATKALLAELAKAESSSFRMTVLRALGEVDRGSPEVVAALLAAMRAGATPRTADLAAEGLAKQGAPGVAALGEALTDGKDSVRIAACKGLRAATDDSARDLLLAALRGATSRDRLAPLEALVDRDEDAVHEVRLALALDKDLLVAAEAVAQLAKHHHAQAADRAMQLQRRLGPSSGPDLHRAVLAGLLTAPKDAKLAELLTAAAAAKDAFGDDLVADWQALMAENAARKFFAVEAPKRKVEGERRVAARALTFVPDADRPTAVQSLVKMAADSDPDVARAVAEALASFGSELADAPLDKLYRQGPEGARAVALAALHGLRDGHDGWPPELLAATKDKLPAVRTAALQLLAKAKGAEAPLSLQAAGEALADPQWQVRGAAIDLVAALRLKPGIPWLIDRVDQEGGRLREDVLGALFDLTRLRFADGKAWKEFWAKAGDTFEIPKLDEQRAKNAPKADTTATYWDIPVRSERVVFVVDVSGSMRETIGTGKVTRLDEAKRQLLRVLELLPAKAKVNIVGFGTKATAWSDKLQPLDKRRKKAAADFVQALTIQGATNVHDGVKLAFQDEEVDTVFLLTDGYPSAGEIVAPGRLAAAIATWNVGRGIRIHTVAIGGASNFLERLAKESGGEHAVSR